MEIKSEYAGLSREGAIAKAFVNTLEQEEALRDLKQNPPPNDPGRDDNFALKMLEVSVNAMNHTFAGLVQQSFPQNDTVN